MAGAQDCGEDGGGWLKRACNALFLPESPLASEYLVALTPRRATRRHADSSERLEFLGDAVVHAALSLYLMRRYPDETEGFLSDMRAKMSCGASMARLSAAMGVGRLLAPRPAIGAGPDPPEAKDSELEDAFEALAGAVQVTSGFEAAYAWIIRAYESHYDFSGAVLRNVSHRDGLTRFCRANGFPEPGFSCAQVQREGFKCVVRGAEAGRTDARKDEDKAAILGVGRGRTAKEATDAAALSALEYVGGRRGVLAAGNGRLAAGNGRLAAGNGRLAAGGGLPGLDRRARRTSVR
jgi:X-X-X-Leu-X-X-Gly heptad repeat protein